MTVLDPRNQDVTITILMPSAVSSGSRSSVLEDALNAEPDWVSALSAARQYRMDNRYLAFWEWLDRMAEDIKATFREDEVPPPVAAYFRRSER